MQQCSQAGWKNYLVWSKMPDNPVLSDPFKNAGCEIILQPRSNRSFDLGSIWRTYKLLQDLNCDIFHCHNDHTSPLIGAVIARVPVRIWSALAMSSYHEKQTQPRGLHRLMPSTRISSLCAHRILAISEEVRRELVENGVSGKRVDVVHGAVDLKLFASASKSMIRKDINISPSDILICSIGRAIYRKGWDIAVKAFADLRSKFSNVQLVLVGSTVSSEEQEVFQNLIEMCDKYNLSGCVHFLGHRDDFFEILKASNIFIFPSRSEGLPGALLEAMAAGLPCIATNTCGMSDVITHGENGLLFEGENSQQLADSLIKLVEDDVLRNKLAAQAKIRAREFSMEKYVDSVFNVYKYLLGKKKIN